MTDTQLVLWTFGKVILNFLPAVIFGIVGLAVLAVDERRERGERVAKMEKTDKRNVA